LSNNVGCERSKKDAWSQCEEVFERFIREVEFIWNKSQQYLGGNNEKQHYRKTDSNGFLSFTLAVVFGQHVCRQKDRSVHCIPARGHESKKSELFEHKNIHHKRVNHNRDE